MNLAKTMNLANKAHALRTALPDMAIEVDGDLIHVDAGETGFFLAGASLAGPGWLDRAKVRAAAARRIAKSAA